MAKSNSNDGAPSQRMLRVGEVIRRTLAQVLMQGDIHDPDLNRLSITVGEVRVSKDLKIATCFVLPLAGEGKDVVLELLGRNKHELRRIVGKKVGLRHTPDLKFLLDTTFDQMDATNAMFARPEVKRDLDN
ncbi:30S ribosome-binding factor RbfA [Lentibacter algarum]|uniref:30S ribosome-binding factor RbfA n=1 Tax=Lentibacter algarum TaxID=576131 RepID=UPI001C06567A|nr:30S ribosome-binding factor RbfA [Lentibacter algarum]MBU2980521.1 30S ribosome-binding factor RbfA [Lentibacter algarum]